MLSQLNNTQPFTLYLFYGISFTLEDTIMYMGSKL